METAVESRIILGVFAGLTLTSLCSAQTESAPPAAEPPPASEPEGLVPIPDFAGGLVERAKLSGDWGGSRSDLARKGVQLNLDWTQIVQGVVAGGRRIDWDYQGSLDAALSLDLHRMKVIPGGVLRARVEGRYGETINDDTGSLLPVNTDGFFPLTGELNESILTVTELNYLQFLGPKAGLTIGKFQTLDGDPNEFASGRGRSQFMNFNFNASGVSALTIPYSTLGGGLMLMPTDRITIGSLLVSTNDSSTTAGFDDLDDGLSWTTEADFQYKLGELPGGTNLGVVYAFDGEYTQLGGKLVLGSLGAPLPAESDSWCVFVSNWQYVYLLEDAPAKVDVANGRQDLRGVGLFGRLGFADQDTNPVEWSLTGGVGAKGLVPGREHDTMGLGFMYSEFQDGGRLASLALEGSTGAGEAYYNIAITPAVGLTFDVQWIDSVFNEIEEAWVVGARLDVRF